MEDQYELYLKKLRNKTFSKEGEYRFEFGKINGRKGIVTIINLEVGTEGKYLDGEKTECHYELKVDGQTKKCTVNFDLPNELKLELEILENIEFDALLRWF